MAPARRDILADRGDAGRRVDLVLQRHLLDLPRASRNRIQGWIEHGQVTVNARAVTRVSARVAQGDRIVVELPDDVTPSAVLPEPGTIDCLFEDEHLLVVNKPAGQVSHPTFGHLSGSLLNVALHYARHWPPGRRPSLVGRLDKFTSGAVVIAKSTDAHARLQHTLASSLSEKTYLAIVYGATGTDRRVVDLRLRRDPADRRRVVASADEGLRSLTRIERLDTNADTACPVSLVRCGLATGRMHQIRVHLTAIGHPIVGDQKYGEPRWTAADDERTRAALKGFARQALHAWRISFVHPYTGERLAVGAPVAPDMAALAHTLGLRLPSPDEGLPARDGVSAVRETSRRPRMP